MMKRKQLWIAVAAVCGSLAVGSVSTTALAADKLMPALTGWNPDNVRTVNGAEPDGRTWIYPSQAARDADVNGDGTGSTGFVIWELDDASGTQPGIQVRTNEPVAEWPLRNCIMASGERAGVEKTCYDAQDSAKRFKLRVTGSESVDLVFDVDDDLVFTYETPDDSLITSRIYRVLMKWANFTNARAQGFKVEVGFKAADGTFTPAAPGDGIEFELSPTVTRASLGEAGGGPDREVWKPLEFATFSPGQYSITGFFDDEVAGLIPPQDESPTLIYSGDLQGAAALGAITANYYDRWGYMLNLALLPTGIYEDADGIAATEGKLKAFWDGTNWRYGIADGFAVVPDSVLASWGAQPLSETQVLQPLPRYEAAGIDDLGGLNVDVYIRLDDNYYTTGAGAAGKDKITLRLTPVAPAAGIPGNEDLPAWLANPAPDIFANAVPPPSDDDGGCTIGSNNRFDPIFPALVAMGLGYFGWRRFKASK